MTLNCEVQLSGRGELGGIEGNLKLIYTFPLSLSVATSDTVVTGEVL